MNAENTNNTNVQTAEPLAMEKADSNINTKNKKRLPRIYLYFIYLILH